MSSRKGFTMGEGKYYLTIKSTPNNITLFRKNKKSAINTFTKYKELGKEVEWLGKWDGKKFTEDSLPASVKSL
jgi:hypothetical protein